MRQSTKILRKVLVILVGLPILVLGAILVPLPGPGLLIMCVGLFILSLEFEWAKRHLDRAKAKLKQIYDKAQARADKIENLGNKPKPK